MNSMMHALQALNVIIQSFFNLLTPIVLSILAGWLLTEKANAPGFVWIPLILFGVAAGFWSMIRFILGAMANLERIEKEAKKRKNSMRKEK